MRAEGETRKLNVSSLIIAFLDCFISDIVKTNDSRAATMSEENYTASVQDYCCVRGHDEENSDEITVSEF